MGQQTGADGLPDGRGDSSGGGVDESACGAASVYADDTAGESGRLDYYNVVHRKKGIVTARRSLLVGGTLKGCQVKGLQ